MAALGGLVMKTDRDIVKMPPPPSSPLLSHQHPLSASHLCHVSMTGGDWRAHDGSPATGNWYGGSKKRMSVPPGQAGAPPLHWTDSVKYGNCWPLFMAE